MTSKTDIARALLSIKAVFLRPDDPFTWASGIKSPIYCDNRLTLSYPDVRSLVDGAIAELIQEHYPQAQILMGTATAGIAHAAIAAEKLKLPMGYVRGSAKDHGRKNRIEGKLEAGDRVVVVEDLISTGGSVIECVEALREVGADVLGVVSIFTYGMNRSRERFAAESLENISLCDLDTLVEVAVEEGYIRPADRGRLLAFRDNPSDESWMSYEA
ncbi:orotate phosphoribosyltransferase [Olsenella sp. Marseille-QA0557]|uniref:orotate phosphoribosyltransferase n=1 Tax=Olsenella sp. Marseille-QA0557 TaxID=3378782 RepID=UPI003D120ECC